MIDSNNLQILWVWSWHSYGKVSWKPCRQTNCSPSLSVSNASRRDCCIRVLHMFPLCPFPPPAFGMTSFTIAILITQVLGYVLALVGLCLCIMGESLSSVFLVSYVSTSLLYPLSFLIPSNTPTLSKRERRLVRRRGVGLFHTLGWLRLSDSLGQYCYTQIGAFSSHYQGGFL